jgi:hypothetical protein
MSVETKIHTNCIGRGRSLFPITKEHIEEKNRLRGDDAFVVNVTMHGACTGRTNSANDTRR